MSTLRRALLSNITFKHISPTTCRHVRCIHPTSAALKKKKQTASSSQNLLEYDDDAFSFSSDGVPEEEALFDSNVKPPPAAAPSLGSSPGVKTPEVLRIRAETYENLHKSTLAILGRPGRLRQPPRKSVVVRLVALSETKEQLERAIDVIAAWRSSTLPLTSKTCDEFIGRCVHLEHPELALKVLQNRPKYGMDIPSLTSARHLLHALAQRRRGEEGRARALHDALALSELYPLYGLPPASKDVVSCAILARVIAQQASKSQISPQEKGEDDSAVGRDPFQEISGELKSAAASWESAKATTPKNVLTGLRSNVGVLMRTVKRKGDTAPWLERLRGEIPPTASNANP